MKCKLCGCDGQVIYKGSLRIAMSEYTEKEYEVCKCENCGTIWNEAWKDLEDDFYESGEYRDKVDGNSEIKAYREKFDKDVLWHLERTGTEIFRDRVVCDIGCGGGSFLDYVSAPAKSVVAIEPNRKYHSGLREQNYSVYSYTSEAVKEWSGKIDVITGFDVIEHVYEPGDFVAEIYELLVKGGKCVMGTPTDYPILREMLGDSFNKFLFQVPHPWIFSEKSLKKLFEDVGFSKVDIVVTQKYGLGNLLAWLNEKAPRGNITYQFISPALDALYKEEMAANGYGEYITVYAEK